MLKVEKLRELFLECLTKRRVLLLAHELTKGIEDFIGTFLCKDGPVVDCNSFENA